MAMKCNKFVSIIVPVYNTSAYIERCIRSIISQTYQDKLECILVDDCGTDNSIELAEKLIAENDSRVCFKIIRHDKNRGLSAARNTGLKVSTGDYLYFLDSDDEITKDCIEMLVSPLVENNYDMVIGEIKILGDEVLHQLLQLKLKDGTVLYQPQILKTYRKKWCMIAQNKLYRKHFIEDNQLHFKEGIAFEDELWSLECACLMKSMRVVGTVTNFYYIHGDNNSIKWAKDKLFYGESYKTIIKEFRQFMEERNIYNHKLYFFIQWFFLNNFLLNYLDDKKLYIEKYREVRPLAWFEWKKRFMANGSIIKYHIRDLHYLLPVSIAPYWQYVLYKLIKGNHGVKK